MTLGERICQYRIERRLSQQEVAEKLEVSRQSVSKWETDGAVPELDKLVKLCELFGVGLDELVRGEKPKGQKAENPEPVEIGTEDMPLPERSNAQVAVGAVLLAVGLLGELVVILLEPGFMLEFAFLTVPMAAFGIVCLKLRENAGAACGIVGFVTIILWMWLPPILNALL